MVECSARRVAWLDGADGGDTREEAQSPSEEEEEEEGDDVQGAPHPSARVDWAKLAERDPVCVGGRMHLEAVAQTMAELIRQTTTECVQRAQLMTRRACELHLCCGTVPLFRREGCHIR